MTAPLDLAAIRARAEAATPGPWETRAPYEDYCVIAAGPGEVICDLGWDGEGDDIEQRVNTERNAAFIAAARTDVPALLEVADAARALLATAPRCDRPDCERIALWERLEELFCDEHCNREGTSDDGPDAELLNASEVRRLAALLGVGA